MFHESSNNELRSPIMWFGEGSYDFGSYSNAHCRFSKEEDPVVFEFKWHSLQKRINSSCEGCPLFDRIMLGYLDASEYKLSIAINSDERGDYLEEVLISGNNHIMNVKSSKDRRLTFYLDGKIIKTKTVYWDYKTEGILPNIKFKDNHYYPTSDIQRLINSLIPDDLQNGLKNFDYVKLYNVKSPNPQDIYSYYEKNRNNNPFMDFIVKAYGADSKEFVTLCNNINLSILIYVLSYADKYLNYAFGQFSYMLPVRHVFGRYIRNKNMSVEKIEPSGKNVAEFILSLNEKELDDFNEFVHRVLEISITVEGADNKSVYVISEWGKDNIIDVGYGYSQIMPIVTTLWNIARIKRSCEFPSIIVIEQPEVHLHPSMQGDIAKLIVEAMKLAKQKKANVQIFVETHSEAFISRLGRYLRIKEKSYNVVSPEDVSVLLFEKTSAGSKITTTSYNQDGYIQKWPIGFLD